MAFIQSLDTNIKQTSPEFLQLNPIGKIPVLVDENGLIFWDSTLMVEYLCSSPGSRQCTWGSITPGSRVRPVASISGKSGVVGDRAALPLRSGLPPGAHPPAASPLTPAVCARYESSGPWRKSYSRLQVKFTMIESLNLVCDRISEFCPCLISSILLLLTILGNILLLKPIVLIRGLKGSKPLA
ncbi:glutathione S-transferase family protein [Halomicronema hongdechloris]|uniref:glutathione S-transferase family protein n=1 Tax=Halomicronema hongdechloris TaxID=1209493 RepID=UPI0037049887